ncbi:Hypothetical protein A7982_03884 [Minicystis rosea]|nr:Hypothetical protein A7982_03884 [Minicystis rosea]
MASCSAEVGLATRAAGPGRRGAIEAARGAWKIAGVGLLVLLGIGLDVRRTRRDAAEG